MGWKVQFYQAESGRKVVEEFIRALPSTAQAKLIRQLDLLEEFGPQLPMPHARPLGSGLYELRVRGRLETRLYKEDSNDIVKRVGSR